MASNKRKAPARPSRVASSDRPTFEKEEVTNKLVVEKEVPPPTQIIEDELPMDVSGEEPGVEEQVSLYVPPVCTCTFCHTWVVEVVTSGICNNINYRTSMILS